MPSNHDEIKLKACPFCGHDDPEVYPTDDESGTVRGGCDNSDCVLFDRFPGNYTSREHFASWWNQRALTPTASEATAIGAGEGLSPRALHWRLLGLAATLRSEEFDEDNSSALDVEEAARRLSAASPKVASDTAPGLPIPDDIPQYDACDITHLEGLAAYFDNYAKEKGRERLPASRDLFNETAKRLRQFDALLAALAASPTASDTDTAIPGGGSLPDQFEAWWATYKHSNRDQVGYAMKKQIAFDAFEAAASPKPDTDTPVDPGVEGVESQRRCVATAIANAILAQDYMMEGKFAFGDDLNLSYLDQGEVDFGLVADAAICVLAAKPIAGMNAGES